MLTIIRGLPGSGKTTLAKQLNTRRDAYHFEADMYFDVDGEYKFDPSILGEAHQWCQEMTQIYISFNRNVIVSNTFTTMKEMKPYLDIAKALETQVQIITCHGNFGSIHDVPKETIKKMKARWQEIEYNEESQKYISKN